MINCQKNSVIHIIPNQKHAERSGIDKRPTRIYHPETKLAATGRIVRKNPITEKK